MADFMNRADVVGSGFQKPQLESYLATVTQTLLTEADFLPHVKDSNGNIDEHTIYYNENKNFTDKNVRNLGAIKFSLEDSRNFVDYAFPFDKNNLTFPIKGETVLIIKIKDEYFWLPFSVTQYPNFREDYKTSASTSEVTISEKKSQNYGDSRQTGNAGTNTTTTNAEKKYTVKEKIKFLKPKEGDTIIQGRVGNTIRFSEFFLTPDGKTSSPSIVIRNFQAKANDNKPIGELVEENINDDGSSIYLVSNTIKVPFKETVGKAKVGFKGYPTNLTGNQMFLNSDRIILSSKVSEFIIFGKGNTGIVTDGNFSVDAKNQAYIHSEKNITLHSKGSNQIFLNSDSGKIFLGKNSSPGDAGADVQKMVLGGELVKILGDLIDAINKQFYLTPSGPTKVSPENAATFNSIKGKLKTILSANNFLSKN